MAMKLVVTKEECPLFLKSSAMKPSVFKNKSYWFHGFMVEPFKNKVFFFYRTNPIAITQYNLYIKFQCMKKITRHNYVLIITLQFMKVRTFILILTIPK